MLTKQEEKILDLAEERLRRGWAQEYYGQWRNDEGDVCLVGAFQWALTQVGHDPGRDITRADHALEYPALGKVWLWFTRRHRRSPMWWNDRSGRSLEDVLLELKLFREDQG